jgi:coproporphyrinogen III oxidase-like Fe-S oxidoreductase
MPKITIHDVANGINETREMNAEELAEYNLMVSEVTAKKAQEKILKEEAEAALLASLNITREQAITLKLIQPDYVPPMGGN